LEGELEVAKKQSKMARKIRDMMELQYDLDEYIDLLRQRQRLGVVVGKQLSEAEDKAAELKADIRKVRDLYNSHFNTMWGQLFKAGYQDSRFGRQVCSYACLYTSRASNLGKADPMRPFRPVRDYMPHDQVLFDGEEKHSREDYSI
jgi:hypothetical protein